MTHFLNPTRQPGESRGDYVRRRKWGAKLLKERLRSQQPADGYEVGPHKSHRPREIQVTELVNGAAVVRRVVHPGTLRKVKA
jgi:hypothetical protein